jgi:flagellar biosynthesis protein FlhF
MKIKRFFAADIRQAMRMVKEELGSDAVIMSNKSVDGGVEIIAARDFDEHALEKKLPIEPKPTLSTSKQLPDLPDYSAEKERLNIISSPRKRDAKNETPVRPLRREVDNYAAYADAPPAAKSSTNAEPNSVFKPQKFTNPGARIASASVGDFYAAATKSTTSSSVKPRESIPQSEVVKPVSFKPEKAEIEQAAPVADKILEQMRKEFRQLKQSMETRLSEVGFAHVASNNPVRLDLLHRLADMGISKKLSLKLANRLGAHSDSEFAFEKALEMLTKVLPIADDNLLQYGGVVALVGPTGVGKTTTIAKLAAKFILKYGPRQVALITTDNYRIAAHEQLNTYGRILDVPVRTASTAEELRSMINQFSDKRLILIDTAGMGPRDMRIAEQLQTLQKNDIPVTTYLVMAATTQYKTMQEIIKAFQIIEPTACILTKMDEAASIGSAISALIEQQLPLSFITDGQQVPEDIHVPKAQALINQCVAELEPKNDYTDAVKYEDWVAEGYA